MIKALGLVIVIGLAWGGVATAQGGCPPTSAQPASVRPLEPFGPQGQDNAQLLVGSTLLLEMAKLDVGKVRSAVEPCDLGTTTVDGQVWTVTGGDKAVVLRAIAPRPDAPVAAIYPVVDLLLALNASKTHTPPPPTRFLLLTVQGSTDTLWRAYDAVPSAAQFEQDLAAAVAGRMGAVATVDVLTKKVNLMVSKTAG